MVERTAFVTQAPYDTIATYPDRGSVEVYTEGAYCELETLGRLVAPAPGDSTRHTVCWSLLRDIDAATPDIPLARTLDAHSRA